VFADELIHGFYWRGPSKPALFTFLVKIKSKLSLPEQILNYNAKAKYYFASSLQAGMEFSNQVQTNNFKYFKLVF